MKRIVFNLLFCCTLLIVASCKNEAAVCGTADKIKELGLYTFNKGEIALLQSVVVDSENGSYSFTAELPYEGLYLLGRHEGALYPLFLEGGDKITADFSKYDMYLSGQELSYPNQILAKWENGVNEVKVEAFMGRALPGASTSNYEIFFNKFDAAYKVQLTLLDEIKDKKGEVLDFLRFKMEADLAFYALHFLKENGYSIPQDYQLPSYYSDFEPDRIFQNPKMLDIPYAGSMLETYVWYVNRDKEVDKWNMDYHVDCLKDKALQQEYILAAASRMKYFDEYQNMTAQVGENFFSEVNMKRAEKIEQKLMWSKPGLVAPDFSAMAPDSTTMKLSDYKGKLVVVDVWATWCEPCRRMMPLFHQLQKEITDENVAFVSVCVGVWIESDKWLQLSKEFHITHDNYFVAGWNSDFVKDYRISGVPRYMIFDKEGNIVTVNAPNPASPRLKELILKQLDK